MNSKISLLTLGFCLLTVITFAQSPVGIWKTIDDETGAAKSHVEIFEKNGKLYGKIVKLLEREPDVVCIECPGAKKNQKVIGLEIICDMKAYDDYWSYGKILDPESGKEYKCNISLDCNDKLDVRGYVGFAALGRTQRWIRVK
ncbi:MAG: hypothetical protein ACI9XO_000646 [Paraglaciecola sp.]|jgi:uncharacterized protein (DUF2147 family)